MTAYDFAAWTDGAVSLWLQRGGGLYWVTAAVVTGFVSATANAWVPLVEIRR
jgi:hypothetical protein